MNLGYVYIIATILFTVYGQIVLKWRINTKSPLPENEGFQIILKHYIQLFTDFYIVSGFAAAFLASLFWMAAMSKFEISFAYPFMSLAPVLVLLLGVLMLGETFTIGKIVGLVIIIIGLIVTVKF